VTTCSKSTYTKLTGHHKKYFQKYNHTLCYHLHCPCPSFFSPLFILFVEPRNRGKQHIVTDSIARFTSSPREPRVSQAIWRKRRWYSGFSNNNTKYNNHYNEAYIKYTKERKKKYVIKAPSGPRTQTIISTAITCRPRQRII
jgi:hypothetical protein